MPARARLLALTCGVQALQGEPVAVAVARTPTTPSSPKTMALVNGVTGTCVAVRATGAVVLAEPGSRSLLR